MLFDKENIEWIVSVDDDGENIFRIKLEHSITRLRRIYNAGMRNKFYEIKLLFAPLNYLIYEMELMISGSVSFNGIENGFYQENDLDKWIEQIDDLLLILENNPDKYLDIFSILNALGVNPSYYVSSIDLLENLFGDGLEWYAWIFHFPVELQSISTFHFVLNFDQTAEKNLITNFRKLELYEQWYNEIILNNYNNGIEFDYIPILMGTKLDSIIWIKRIEFEKAVKNGNHIDVSGNIYTIEEVQIYRNQYLEFNNPENFLKYLLKNPYYPMVKILMSAIFDLSLLLTLLDQEPYSLYAAFQIREVYRRDKLRKIAGVESLDKTEETIYKHKMMKHIEKYFPLNHTKIEEINLDEIKHQESYKYIFCKYGVRLIDLGVKILRFIHDQPFLTKVIIDDKLNKSLIAAARINFIEETE